MPTANGAVAHTKLQRNRNYLMQETSTDRLDIQHTIAAVLFALLLSNILLLNVFEICAKQLSPPLSKSTNKTNESCELSSLTSP
jgi:hypothetical protein